MIFCRISPLHVSLFVMILFARKSGKFKILHSDMTLKRRVTEEDKSRAASAVYFDIDSSMKAVEKLLVQN